MCDVVFLPYPFSFYFYRMSSLENVYQRKLDGNKKHLYLEKLKILGNVDPYSMKADEFVTSLENVPLPSTATILNYLLFRASKVTSLIVDDLVV